MYFFTWISKEKLILHILFMQCEPWKPPYYPSLSSSVWSVSSGPLWAPACCLKWKCLLQHGVHDTQADKLIVCHGNFLTAKWTFFIRCFLFHLSVQLLEILCLPLFLLSVPAPPMSYLCYHDLDPLLSSQEDIWVNFHQMLNIFSCIHYKSLHKLVM